MRGVLRRDVGPPIPDEKLRGGESFGPAPAGWRPRARAQEVWPVHATHLTEGPVHPEGRKTGTK